MKVRDFYVACVNPIYKENSKIELSEEDKLDMMEREMEKLEKIEVAGVGSKVEDVKKGDMVYMEPGKILRAPRVTIEGKNYFFVREHDILFVY